MSKWEAEVIYLENVIFKLLPSVISVLRKENIRKGMVMIWHTEWKTNMFFYIHIGVYACIKLIN